MKIAYLILAHNNPNHLRRLIRSISSPNAIIYIHIDKKSRIEYFKKYCDSSIVYLKKRIPVYWGDFSTVQAILLLIGKALSTRIPFDYLILLSGNDYPIHSTQYIENYLKINEGKEFINCVPMPNELAGKPISRLTNFHYSQNAPIVIRLLRKTLNKFGLLPRFRDFQKYLGDIQPYGGSTWWCLSRESCEYILEFVKTRPWFVQFFRNTTLSDEMFFQTILGNSSFKEKIHRNLMYTDWSNQKAHPANINQQHLEHFKMNRRLVIEDHYGRGEVLFARKFTDDSGELVKQLDKIRNSV